MRLNSSVATCAACLLFPMTSPAQPSNKKLAAEVDALFREFTGDAPGASVLVIRNGGAVLKKSYGLADVEKRVPASPKTTYRLASVSKQFTAAAILLLVERGKLSLDDNLVKLFPGFPEYGREIQVRHLLNHTSGLLAYEDLLPREATEPVLDRDVLAILKRQDKTYSPPGTKFRYSNSGYALLACLVEDLSGMTYPEFLERNLFHPAGMRGTYLNLQRFAPRRNRAYGHSKKDGKYVRTDQSMTSYVLGDGGIYSSLEDLQKWEAALAGAKLLSKKMLDEAMTATVPTGEGGAGYGYGWYVGQHGDAKAVWHGGSSIGFRNHYLRIPEKSLTVIVLTNRNEADPAKLAGAVADIYLRN